MAEFFCLRKHIRFWAVIAVILALHVPLVFMVRRPQGNVPTISYAMPIEIADFLIISGALSLAEKLFSKSSSFDDKARMKVSCRTSAPQKGAGIQRVEFASRKQVRSTAAPDSRSAGPAISTGC
jgi:hypothetical protein